MAQSDKILILGKLPPPVGGVTIHASRLAENLHLSRFQKFEFYDFGRNSFWNVLSKISCYKVSHLHTSSPYLQLATAVFCYLRRRKLIITYHGNWGRFGLAKTLATKYSAKMAYLPIVVNADSLNQAYWWNRNSILISPFILPANETILKDSILGKIVDIKKAYRFLFCTTSWKLTFDKNGKETYGVSDLVRKFSQSKLSALIISDPSGTNKKHFENISGKVPENIFYITEEHDFVNILERADAYIRNTSTDGDSITIREALYYRTIVFASASITRPFGCQIFENINRINFEEELVRLKSLPFVKAAMKQPDGTINDLIKVYEEALARE